ncbi:hypothetical protein [Variovorax paradoxus]|jgi:hypothetical protein|uniref:hypothetical protein n=1 Tax=Variovorax paradoxus TaxID=34073 RepID=UPI002480AC2A|nr:hypothetical protein [Variovorax paradoxus]WGT63285.1 hypothetical protein QHG62_25165 [Variovorax paradoxus]
MLTIFQKATILSKAGFEVPDCPAEDSSATSTNAVSQKMHEWGKAIETMYVAYVAARAAKSLRDAEESRQTDMLRRLSLTAWAA